MIRLRIILLPLFCVIGISLQAQEKNVSKVSFALRGKYYVFGALEDLVWRGYSYGGELHIGKHHSIGVDGGMFRTRVDNDSDDMGLTSTDDPSYTMYSEIYRRTYMYVDYKFLFPVKFQWMYANLYTKQLGKFYYFSKGRDETYTANHAELLAETGRGAFTEYGLGLGAMLYFKRGESPLGFDVNLNLAFRNGSKLSSDYRENKGWVYVSESDDFIYPYLRITLFYHFFRYKQ